MTKTKLRLLLVDDEKEFVEGFLEERTTAPTYVAANDSCNDSCAPDTLGQILLNMNQPFGGFVDLGVIDADGNQRSYVGRYPG